MGLLPKNIELLPPCDDRVFKVLLASPEAKPMLLYLASAIIGRPVVDVLIRSNELPITDIDEKVERFDVNCIIDGGIQADIEMQANRMQEEPGSSHSNLRARSIFNLCDLHSSQVGRGKAYDKLSQTYQVMFCGYTVFADRPSFMNAFSMRHDVDNGLLHNAVKVLFVELTKLKEILEKPVEEMTDMEKISIFLCYAEDPKHRDFVNSVIQSKEELGVAGEVLMSISQDEREKAIYRNRRIYQKDLESNIQTAEDRGKAEGIIMVARNFLDLGETVEKVMLATGLSREEVESLKKAN